MPVHPVVELDGVQVQPSNVVGDAVDVAAGGEVGDEAVTSSAQRIREDVDGGASAVALDAVAAFRLW